MTTEAFYNQARGILLRMLAEAPHTNREQLVDMYADMLAQLYANESHNLLNQVMDDARMRLDARLSPDPVSQGIASVQTTMQDLWRSFWQE
jgi:hypothetical protein